MSIKDEYVYTEATVFRLVLVLNDWNIITQLILGKNYACAFLDVIVESSLIFNTEYENLISQRHM